MSPGRKQDLALVLAGLGLLYAAASARAARRRADELRQAVRDAATDPGPWELRDAL